jgi:hypothetical protein
MKIFANKTCCFNCGKTIITIDVELSKLFDNVKAIIRVKEDIPHDQQQRLMPSSFAGRWAATTTSCSSQHLLLLFSQTINRI